MSHDKGNKLHLVTQFRFKLWPIIPTAFERKLTCAASVIFRPTLLGLTFYVVSWGGVRLSPLGKSGTIWPIVPAPDAISWWVWSSRWNENRQEKPKYSEKTWQSATLSTTNLTWPDMGSNPGHGGGKRATNRLGYGTAWNPTMSGIEPGASSP
jgi:hypothetical protein